MEVRRIPMEELYHLLEEQLARGSAQLPVTGSSMSPTFRGGRDLVRLEKRDAFSRGDVILYRRENGQFVLHRIMEIAPSGVICCGDRQTEYETIHPRQVLAVVTAFCRKGTWRDVRSLSYRLYVKLWMIMPVRKSVFWVRELLRRFGV